MNNKTLETIYVKLIGEQVDVWRPVQAEHFRDDIYLIVDQPYDRDSETWQFGPGSSVICELVESADGPILGGHRASYWLKNARRKCRVSDDRSLVSQAA